MLEFFSKLTFCFIMNSIFYSDLKLVLVFVKSCICAIFKRPVKCLEKLSIIQCWCSFHWNRKTGRDISNFKIKGTLIICCDDIHIFFCFTGFFGLLYMWQLNWRCYDLVVWFLDLRNALVRLDCKNWCASWIQCKSLWIKSSAKYISVM